MHQKESDDSYFLINAGHPRALLRPPADLGQRLVWGKWLKATVGAIAFSSAVALSLAASGAGRPVEATVQMERLAAKVEHAKSIHPKTAHEIMGLIGQPWYDCNQVACSAPLKARNSAARNRLQTLIAKKTPLNNFAHEPRVVGADLSPPQERAQSRSEGRMVSHHEQPQ
jgi:hypothetical protein